MIAAFGKNARFIALQEQLTDEFLLCNWATLAANRLLSLAVDITSIAVVACAAFFSVFGRDTVGPASSIALTYAMQVKGKL